MVPERGDDKVSLKNKLLILVCGIFAILVVSSREYPRWRGIITHQEIFSFLVLCSIMLYLVWIKRKFLVK